MSDDMPEVASPEGYKTKQKKKILEGLPQNPDHSEETTPEAAPEPRKPGFGDGVRYVDNRESAEQVLDASVMVALEDGGVHLRVLDPTNQFGHFDVTRPEYDANKTPGTWHFPED